MSLLRAADRLSRRHPRRTTAVLLAVVVPLAVLLAFGGADAVGRGLAAVLPQDTRLQAVLGASWFVTAAALLSQAGRFRRPWRTAAAEVTGVAMVLLAVVVVPVGRGSSPEGAGPYVPGFALGLLVAVPVSAVLWWLAVGRRSGRPDPQVAAQHQVATDARRHGRWDRTTGEHVLPLDWTGGPQREGDVLYARALARYRRDLRSTLRVESAVPRRRGRRRRR